MKTFLLQIDNANHRVVQFNLNGNIVNQFSTGQGSYPRGIAFGPDGYIYVSRDLYNDIAVYNPNTFVFERTITRVTNPYGIAFDPINNHLFVVNFPKNNILELFIYWRISWNLCFWIITSKPYSFQA
jgi:DNA-binding beta-propeller fold protein YncE